MLSIILEELLKEMQYNEEGDTIKEPHIHHLSCLTATCSHVQLNNSRDLF